MLVILASYDQNKKWNLFVFEVGPSLEFVSAIKDAIFNKKMGVNFFFEHFFRFFFCNLSLSASNILICSLV